MCISAKLCNHSETFAASFHENPSELYNSAIWRLGTQHNQPATGISHPQRGPFFATAHRHLRRCAYAIQRHNTVQQQQMQQKKHFVATTASRALHHSQRRSLRQPKRHRHRHHHRSRRVAEQNASRQSDYGLLTY